MQHLDLWFDLAVRGEPNLEEDAVARLQLTDGADPDPRADDRGNEEPAPTAEFF